MARARSGEALISAICGLPSHFDTNSNRNRNPLPLCRPSRTGSFPPCYRSLRGPSAPRSINRPGLGASFVNTAVANIWAKAGQQSHQCAPACAICGVLSQPTPNNWRHEELIATTRNMRGGVAFERGRLKTVPFCCYSLVLASS